MAAIRPTAILSGGAAYWRVRCEMDGKPCCLAGRVRLDLAIGQARRHFDPLPFDIEVRHGVDDAPIEGVTWVQNAQKIVATRKEELRLAEQALRHEQEELVASLRGKRIALCDIATMAGLSKKATQALLDTLAKKDGAP